MDGLARLRPPPTPCPFNTTRQAQEDAAFLHKVEGMLASSSRHRDDEAFDDGDDDDEASFGGVNLGTCGRFAFVCE